MHILVVFPEYPVAANLDTNYNSLKQDINQIKKKLTMIAKQDRESPWPVRQPQN